MNKWPHLALWFLALNWYLLENSYFGWNARPQSLPELAADGFLTLLCVIAAFSHIDRISTQINTSGSVIFNPKDQSHD